MKTPGEFRVIQQFLRVLAGPQRLKILFLLRDGERCVCEIQDAIRLPQNLVSYHLKVLREAGLVSARREGVALYYRIERRTLQKYRSLFHIAFRTDD